MDDEQVPEQLLARLAHKVYPDEGRLERFATTLIRIEHVRYCHIIDDAGRDPWRKCYYVSISTWFWLNYWSDQIKDLFTPSESGRENENDQMINDKLQRKISLSLLFLLGVHVPLELTTASNSQNKEHKFITQVHHTSQTYL